MLLDLLLWVISEITKEKKEEIIIVCFSYSGGDYDGFIGHKSIHIISSSN